MLTCWCLTGIMSCHHICCLQEKESTWGWWEYFYFISGSKPKCLINENFDLIMMPHEKFLILAEGNIVQMFSVWGQSSGPMLSSPEPCSKRVNTDMFECNIVHYYTWINNSRAKSCKNFLSPEMHESMSAQSCQEKKKNGCNVKSDTHTHTQKRNPWWDCVTAWWSETWSDVYLQ